MELRDIRALRAHNAREARAIRESEERFQQWTAIVAAKHDASFTAWMPAIECICLMNTALGRIFSSSKDGTPRHTERIQR